MPIGRVLFAVTGAALIASAAALAETSTRVGDYSIQHNAITTDMLDPQVAEANGILRSRFRGMLHVALVKGPADTKGRSIAAGVEARASAPRSEASRVPMREIRTESGVSYIGEFPVKDRQTLVFEIEVAPEEAAETFRVSMEQQFFVD